MDSPNIARQFSIKLEEYNAFCTFLEQATGIVLGTDKSYLVNSRLQHVMVDNKISNVAMLIETMKRQSSLRETVIEAMTTNETTWFRDVHPYNVLLDRVFPQYRGKNQLRIWSAACSTGQEPYSISMCLSEYAEKISWMPFANIVKILGTDISAAVLERAKKGEYTYIEIERGLSPERKKKFFEYLSNGRYKLRDIELARVAFQQFNLLSSFMPFGKFDVIFCRNVLIYFSLEIKINIINRFAGALNKDGYLFLGSSESMPQQCNQFKVINCQPGIIYQKI